MDLKREVEASLEKGKIFELQKNNYLCLRIRGVLAGTVINRLQAEIIPILPDADNADEGNEDKGWPPLSGILLLRTLLILFTSLIKN